MDFFNTYLIDKCHNLGLVILDFLAYVFRVHIREENMILTPICNYDTIQTGVKSSVEGRYYKHFKRLYSMHFTINGNFIVSDYRSIYFASILGDPAKSQKQFISLLDNNNSEIVFNVKVALMLIHFRSPQYKPFDKTIGMSILQSCSKKINTLFGAGYHQAIFWCVKLYMDSIDHIEIQIDDVNQIMKLYTENSNLDDNSYLEDVEVFPNILIENVSSILFRVFFGIGKVIDKNRLNIIQIYFLSQLYMKKTHTNTLLYCGILPDGISKKQIAYCPNVYDCYSFNYNSIKK